MFRSSPKLNEIGNLSKFTLNTDNPFYVELSLVYFNLAHQNNMLIQLYVKLTRYFN